MVRVNSIRHEFVDRLPAILEDGVAYVSIRYTVVIHLCCCGCRNKVVTPLNPEGWKMTFDGKSISLSPSIGNKVLPCRSHYWICQNRIQWVPIFSEPIPETERRARGLWESFLRFISNRTRKR